MATPAGVTTIRRRVDYSETDQMGVVYHARYLVWLDVARTEHLRATGLSYRELEAEGVLLVVSGVNVRYRHPARYDDPIRVRAWVRELVPRQIVFGYAIEHDETNILLSTATTSLLVLNPEFRPTRLPERVTAALHTVSDLVRL